MVSHDEEFYQLSKYLLESSSKTLLVTFQDCTVRTSISRAFYFSYHKLINLIKHCFKINMQQYTKENKQGTHIAIVKILESNGLDELAYNYNRLRDYRTKADYKLNYQLPKYSASQCIEMAEIIANDVDDLLERSGFFKS